MKSDLLLLFEKPNETLIEKTKSKPQEMLEFKLKRQMETFSFSPPINLVEDAKWLLAVTFFEATNSIFNITDENSSFLISTTGQWSPEGSGGIIDNLDKMLELRSQNDIELHVKEFEKRGTRTEKENGYSTLAVFDLFKSEILARLKRVDKRDLDDMV